MKIPKQWHTECPTPKKVRFATQEAADEAVRRASFELDKTLYTYDTCPCGWIHLTSKKSRVNETPSLTGMAKYSDDTFTQAVRDDVRKIAHPDDSAALRHPENLHRWLTTLNAFTRDLERQLAYRSGDRSLEASEWRKRIQIVRLSTADRKDECKALISQVNKARSERRKEERARRNEAGERAIDRLIEAHREEFDRYLIEECQKIDVEVPRRVRRYIELRELEKET